MIVSVGYDNILIVAEAESMRRVELSLATSELSELEPDMHRRGLGGADQRRRGSHQSSFLRGRQQRPARGHASGPDPAHPAHSHAHSTEPIHL